MLEHCQGCAGLANPGPVATALWTDAELEAGVTLDGIVTVNSCFIRNTASVPTDLHWVRCASGSHNL